MKYGYFDDKKREYVIERPDTPKSWSNYLGSTRYGAIITNNAGGYSFYQSAAQGRFTRLRFNSIPMDQPGRYFYIHDRDSKNYWSASWQPVGKPLDDYTSECRHGLGYTKIRSQYAGIETESTYFVPLNKDMEFWLLKVRNTDRRKRSLRIFTYVEYACNWNVADDLNNLQYTQYIAQMKVEEGIIDHGTNVNIPEMQDKFEEKDQGRHTFLAVTGAPVTGYDTDRETFLGPYRTYGNPQVVEQGACKNSLASGGNPCGTLQIDLELAAGEEKEIAVIMGIGRAATVGKQMINDYKDLSSIHTEFASLKAFWEARTGNLTVDTPDAQMNSMLNVWNPYNCFITYYWSRAASLIYSGARDGLGYRDTVQDILGVLHQIPEETRERLELMITGQVSSGGAMPVVKPFSHYPGREKAPTAGEYRSDDALWLFYTIPEYVKETGNIDFYRKVLPYADQGSDTVLGHLKKAIEFSLERSGDHGLTCGLSADWNDCIQLGYSGETVFVTFQLRYALKTYMEICSLMDIESEQKWAHQILNILDKNIEKYAWDGDWFLRAYRHDGLKFGSRENEEGKIFLNPQTWAVISKYMNGEKSKHLLDKVETHLATPYGLMLCAPPFKKTDYTVMRATLFNPGKKENASIFNHTQGWAVMAEALAGRGNRAFQYYKAGLPAAYNERCEIRLIEPYVYSQSTDSKFSSRYGNSHVPWLTGAATWAYHASTHYILGIRPDYTGLIIAPCIPSEWNGFKVTRTFRDAVYHITVKNPDHVCSGIKKIQFNGEEFSLNLIPVREAGSENTVEVILGK